MLQRVLRAIGRAREEEPVEPVELHVLRDRIGEPAPRERRLPREAYFTRVDAPASSERRGWRDAVGV